MSIDYQTTRDQYVAQINNELADVESLNPTQMVTKLQHITKSGLQPYVIQTIRSCIQHYQKDRGIMKYAHITDKLLKLPGWNQLIQNVIVQFFCDIFVFLLIQKCFNQIDELKIIRKFWLKTIHPKLLQTMRDFILTETAIDIDQYFKNQAIELLKNHYEKKLRLSPEEMSFHLPKTLKTSNAIYESHINKTQKEPLNQNANYLISHPTNVPSYVLNPSVSVNILRHSPQPMINDPNYSYRNTYAPAQPMKYYQNPRQMVENDSFRMKANVPQRVSPPIDPRDPRMNIHKGYVPHQNMVSQRENIPFYPERTQYMNENYKRQRLYSEETRTPNSAEYMVNQGQAYPHQNYPKSQYEKYEMVPPPPQKKIHYNEEYITNGQQSQKMQNEQQKPKNVQILQMLRNDRIYRCKQCGKGYKSMAEYEKHTTEHFEEKMTLREKKKAVSKLLSIDEWTQKGSGSSLQQFEQFYITLSNLSSEQKKNFYPLQLKCQLCNQSFDLKFRHDQWTLSNATYCQIDGKLTPMHKTCQQGLEESSSEEYY